MVQSGRLKKVAGQLNIWELSRETAHLEDLPQRVWYGKLHQLGFEGTATIEGEPTDATGPELAEAVLSGQRVQFGAPSIPARPFLVFQDEDVEQIERVFVLWLTERMVRNGFKVPGF